VAEKLDGYSVNPNKFERVVNLLTVFDVQFDDFPSVLHKFVQGLRYPLRLKETPQHVYITTKDQRLSNTNDPI
jgi:hypothetical protein